MVYPSGYLLPMLPMHRRKHQPVKAPSQRAPLYIMNKVIYSSSQKASTRPLHVASPSPSRSTTHLARRLCRFLRSTTCRPLAPKLMHPDFAFSCAIVGRHAHCLKRCHALQRGCRQVPGSDCSCLFQSHNMCTCQHGGSSDRG